MTWRVQWEYREQGHWIRAAGAVFNVEAKTRRSAFAAAREMLRNITMGGQTRIFRVEPVEANRDASQTTLD